MFYHSMPTKVASLLYSILPVPTSLKIQSLPQFQSPISHIIPGESTWRAAAEGSVHPPALGRGARRSLETGVNAPKTAFPMVS